MRRIATLLLLTTLFIAACGSDGDTTAETTTTAEGTSDTTTTSASASGDCPQGSWALSTEALQSYYDVIEAESGGGTFTVEGRAVLDLGTDGTLAYRFEDYALTIEAAGVTTRVVFSGVINGTYTADGSKLLTQNLVDQDLQATVTVNGTTTDASTFAQKLLNDFPINHAAYRCEGSDMVVDFKTVNSRTPVTLTPA